MGRWSRLVAKSFLDWLGPLPGLRWLELGCGTGALTSAICQRCRPASIIACDPSSEFVSLAQESIQKCPATFVVASADHLPHRVGGFDFTTSGLVLNFLPDPEGALDALVDRVRPGGVISAYVWDYSGGMQFLRVFWDEATALDRDAAELDEGRRFKLCRIDALSRLFRRSGLREVQTKAIEIPTAFPDFKAYWSPFLGGTGPAPGYVQSLKPHQRGQLEHRLKRRLERSDKGPILMTARAFAVRGVVHN